MGALDAASAWGSARADVLAHGSAAHLVSPYHPSWLPRALAGPPAWANGIESFHSRMLAVFSSLIKSGMRGCSWRCSPSPLQKGERVGEGGPFARFRF